MFLERAHTYSFLFFYPKQVRYAWDSCSSAFFRESISCFFYLVHQRMSISVWNSPENGSHCRLVWPTLAIAWISRIWPDLIDNKRSSESSNRNDIVSNRRIFWKLRQSPQSQIYLRSSANPLKLSISFAIMTSRSAAILVFALLIFMVQCIIFCEILENQNEIRYLN